MKLSKIAINSRAIEAGRWVNIPDLPGVSLKVRGLGNADYRKLAAKLGEEIPRADKVKGISFETRDDIEIKLLIEAVLIDWRGLENDDGSPLAYSREIAESVLPNPDFKPLRDAVMWAAAVVGDDELASDEAAAKN